MNGTDSGIPENSKASKCRHSFFKELNQFPAQLRNIKEKSGEIATGTAKTGGPPGCHRIAFQVDPNERNCIRSFDRCLNCIWSGRDDYVALKTNQLVGEIAKSVEGAPKDARLNSRVLAINIPSVTQRLKECRGVLILGRLKKPDPGTSIRQLLRAGG